MCWTLVPVFDQLVRQLCRATCGPTGSSDRTARRPFAPGRTSLSSVTSPNSAEKMSIRVTPGNVSFVNCGKSSIVISPYFSFICWVDTPAFGGERCTTAGSLPRPAAAPAPAPCGAAHLRRRPARRLLLRHPARHCHGLRLRVRRRQHQVGGLENIPNRPPARGDAGEPIFVGLELPASACSAGLSTRPAAVSPAPAARKKSRRSMPLAIPVCHLVHRLS